MISPNVTERDAERMVCGMLIRRPDKANEIRDALSPDDFGDFMLRSIYIAAMTSISSNGTTDGVATTLEHQRLYPGRNAGVDILECSELYRETNGAAQPKFYCGQVKEFAQRRKMREIADDLIERSMQTDADVADSIAEARRRLSDVDQAKGDIKTIGEVMYETLDYAERLAKGKIVPVLSGLDALDKITGGFYPGELTYIGALPSIGKSAAAITVTLAAPKQGKQVLFASAEMDTIQMGQRVFSDTANVNATRIRKPVTLTEKDWDAMGAALGEWNGKPVRYLFERNLERIIANARREVERGECDVLMLDYVQLLTTNTRFSQDRLRVEYISHELKALAKELNVPVIALAQLTRPPKGDKAVPRIQDFGDSSAIERDADMAILLHRPEFPDDDIFKQDGFKDDKEIMARLQGTGKRLVYLIVGKQRMGPTAICTTLFDGAHNRFAALER